jgi:hypothetical protein
VGDGLELLAHDDAELALGGLAERGSGSPQGSEQGRPPLDEPALVVDPGQVVGWVLDLEHRSVPRLESVSLVLVD